MDNQTLIFIAIVITFITVTITLFFSLSSYYSAIRTLNILRKLDQQVLLNDHKKDEKDNNKVAELSLTSEEIEQNIVILEKDKKDFKISKNKEIINLKNTELNIKVINEQSHLDLELSGFSEVPQDNMLATVKDRINDDIDLLKSLENNSSSQQEKSKTENKIKTTENNDVKLINQFDQIAKNSVAEIITTKELKLDTLKSENEATTTVSPQDRAKAIFDQIKMSANQPKLPQNKDNKISIDLINASFDKSTADTKIKQSGKINKDNAILDTKSEDTKIKAKEEKEQKEQKEQLSKSKLADFDLSLPEIEQDLSKSNLAFLTEVTEKDNKLNTIDSKAKVKKNVQVDLELSAFSEVPDDPMVADARDRGKATGDPNQLINLVASIREKKMKALNSTNSEK